MKKFLAISAAAGLLMASSATMAQVQQDDFVGYYDGGNWLVENVPAGNDGTATFTATTLNIVGGNNGTSDAYIYVTILTGGFGLWEFDWFYDSTDVGQWDSAGYIHNGVEHHLAYNEDGPIGGTVSVNVNAGDEIGFYVFTVDGAFGPGVLDISNHTAPVPAPGALALLGLAGLIGARRRRR